MMLLSALILTVTVCSCQPQLLVRPLDSSITLPSGQGMPLVMATALTCGIIPNTTEYTTRWTLPSGEMINGRGISGQFIVSNNAIAQYPQGTLLGISNLSYNNSGNYTCSVEFTGGAQAGKTGSGTIQLSLLVKVRRIVNSVRRNVGQDVFLSCVMEYYIYPDRDFQWMRENQRITVTTGKYDITYINHDENKGQIGGVNLTFSRLSSLRIYNLDISDEGLYICIVVGSGESSAVQLFVNPSTTSTMQDSTTQSNTAGSTANTATLSDNSNNQGSSFPLPIVAAIAAVLGLIVIVLIVLIVLVSLHKKKKTSTVTLDTPATERDLNENTAYESTSNGGAIHGGGLPKYARIDKQSISPPPPLPARPSTNLSMSAGNSSNSAQDFDHTPPGYDTPFNVVSSVEKSVTIDPYYDNPEDIKPPPPAKKKHTYYDEISLGEDHPFSPGDETPYGISSVPSPAVVLSGSLKRNIMDNPSPDFSYPPYNEEGQGNGEHDYDQIYSEPLDPTMLRQHEYELESSNEIAIPYSAIYEDPQPLHDSSIPLRVTASNIVEIKRLGMGQFGNVILARTVGISMKDLKFSETDTDPNKSTLVAIKKLKTDADGCLMEAFEKEVKFMVRLNHDNVIRLLGVCTVGESFIMMEYMENGDLNQFIQRQHLMPDTIAGLQENEVTPIILLYIGVQIASGMHYLSSHRFVHRDLATRNCLVGREFIVKISDFGMSRSLYESAYYRVQGTLVLPIRWMACETFYGKFSVKSDAWAFGVVLWEIYTLGKVDPYDNMSDEEVIADAIRGPDRLILERPPNCPQDVYEIMLRCWVHEPSMRADFGEIYSRLFMIYTRQAL